MWARNHGYTPSVTAMVSAEGRLFYINDETPFGMLDSVPSKWNLVARDAFNGVLLWKVPMKNWGSKAISGISDYNNSPPRLVGRWMMPMNATKRLVAVGDTVYLTMGAFEPVTAINAATGKVNQAYPGTENTDEILVDDNSLIVAQHPSITILLTKSAV